MSESNIWCYHGKISRDAAHKILVGNGHPGNGTYLIRDCSAAAGDYVLSLWYANQPMHYQIQCFGDNKFGIQDGPTFHGLDSLVRHYQISPDGLPCKLTEMSPGGFLPPFSTLKYGRDTNLHRACIDGNIATVRGLLEDPTTRRDINSRNTQGYTPLHLSCARGEDDIVALLIAAGADVCALDALGRSSTMLVCHAGHASTLKLLILHGRVDIHERCPSTGYVPLHQVAVRGFLDCVEVLLSFKASLNPRAFDGDTPRDVALKHGNTHIVEHIDSIPVSKPRTVQSQWLHQNLDRLSAVEILETPLPTGGGLQSGSFLVRSSVRCFGYYVLSAVGYNRKIYHYQIRQRADRWFFIDDGPLFDSLEHLIDHYMEHTDGLAMALRKPVPSLRQSMKLPPVPTAAGGQDSRNAPPMKDLTANKDFEKFEDDFNRIVERSIKNKTIAGGQSIVPTTNTYVTGKPTPVVSTQPQLPIQRQQPQPTQPQVPPAQQLQPLVPPAQQLQPLVPPAQQLQPLVPPQPQLQPLVPPTPQPQPQPPRKPTPPQMTSRPLPPQRQTVSSQSSQPGVVQGPSVAAPNSGMPAVVPNAPITPPQTSILADSLERGQEIGMGEFGSVLKGVWTNPAGKRVEVAMKTLHRDKLQQGEKEFLRESRVMSHLNHPCIVRLLGVCVGPPMVLVTELVKMGALLDYIIDHAPPSTAIQEVDQKVWAAQIAMGMQYLEEKRFVHRDLATRNILLANKGHCKISDFGLSRAVGADSDIYQAQAGGRWPVKWYAPESINYGTFSHKTDVWSYGVTLWEMFTYGDLPYGEKSGGEVIAFVEKGNRLEKPEGCPDHTYKIMLRCWHIDPAQRPTFNELHGIFSTDPEYEDARRYRKANNAANGVEASS